MRFSSLLSVGLAALANAQTPPGYPPSSNVALNVTYGTQALTANQTLTEAATAQRPVISLSGKHNGTFFVALVDWSIRNSQVSTNQTLVQGIAANRTTRLHWLQTGVTQAANGTLVYDSKTAIAPYAGPKPPAGDIAHTYVLYLFAQPANSSFTALTGSNAGRNYTDNGNARYNFNVTALANTAVNHTVVAANYFRVQNTTATNSTGAGGAAASSSSSRPASSTTSRASTSGTAAPTTAGNGTAVSTFRGAAATPFVAAGLFGLAGAGALALL